MVKARIWAGMGLCNSLILAFFLLTLSILGLWIRRDSKIWGPLLSLNIVCGIISGNILWLGALFLLALITLWFLYAKKPNIALFTVLVIATLCFKLRLVPGYHCVLITSKFQIGLEGPITGLLPLALVVPLSRTVKDWAKVIKGFLLGCAGIGILAILATIAGATHWDMTIPSSMPVRIWSNLFLTCIPEEAFFRGFLQTRLCRYLGKTGALLLASLLFTLAHIYWSPTPILLSFVFLSSLLYGGVYLLSGKIESAILTHFLLNLVHMLFFQYHAT